MVDSRTGATAGDGSAAELVEAATRFAERELGPLVAEYDREERLPREQLEEMGRLGFLGGTVPVAEGGQGLAYSDFVALLEGVSLTCHSVATVVSMPSGLLGAGLLRHGSAEQKERWLRPLAGGELFGAAAITEPDSGSDLSAIRTAYRRDGEDFVLDGRKAWISNLDVASFLLTFACAEPGVKGAPVTAFLVPADSPGLTLSPYRDKLGFRPLCVGDVGLDGVRVPADAVLGEEGAGLRIAMGAVERGRIGVAARCLGMIAACLADTVAHARERRAFGRPIAEFQLVQSAVTEMRVGLTTARLLTHESARAFDAGTPTRQLSSMAKMYAADVACRSSGDAVRVLGAAGVSAEQRVGRLFRDAKVMQTVEGPNDLHRALVAEIELGLRSGG